MARTAGLHILGKLIDYFYVQAKAYELNKFCVSE